MILTLIGYRATGKTTLAQPLAQRLGWSWVDADVEIERRAGCTIREIFDAGGEPDFRRLERTTLVDLLTRDRLVLAAGGGAVLDPETRQDFKAAGPAVWLKASVDTIVQRLYGDETTADRRPNLTAAGGREEIEGLLDQREPIYRDVADLIIQTDEPFPGDSVAPTIEQMVEYVIGNLGETLSTEASTADGRSADGTTEGSTCH